jgi:gliding motility-associated-like protein
MKPITHLFVLGLLLLAHSVAGQITTSFAPATTSVPVGQTVSLQLRVTNFNNISSIQLPIAYNKTVLQFDSISQSVLPGFTSGNYSTPAAAAANGRVTVSWFADQVAYPNGFTVANNNAIFTLYFKALAGGSSTVNLTTSAPGIEVLTSTFQNVTVNYQNGGNTTTVTGGGGGPGPIPPGFHVVGPTGDIPQGSTVCFPVTVYDFENMLTSQFVLHYDPAVLQFVEVKNFGLPGMSASGNFNPNTPGNLNVVWWDDAGVGVTRPDGHKIFDVCFKAIGAVSTTSAITFDGNGLPPSAGGAEASNVTGTNLWTAAAPIGGTITVTPGQAPPNAVTFTVDTDTVAFGQQTCIDVTVDNFIDVVSAQFSLQFDQTKLQYQSITLNPLLPGPNYNTGSAATSGIITYAWFDNNVAGVDLPDNTIVMTVCFTAVGAAGSQSAVTFTNNPVEIEVAKEPGGPVIPSMVNGHVLISGAQLPSASATSTNNNCAGMSAGTITVSVNNCASPTFNWADITSGAEPQNRTGLAAGNYAVTVTCAGGATVTATATVTAPPAISAAPIITNPTCPGQNSGSITIVPSGGSGSGYGNYAWSGPNGNIPGNTATISNLGAGTNYKVTFTDGAGCTYTSPNMTVTVPAAFTPNATVNNVGCAGQNNGSITTNVQGGTAPYNYAWSSGFNTASISNLGAGDHILTVTDANGCTFTSPTYSVTAAPAVVLNFTATNVKCHGANDGAIFVNPMGGTGLNYTYQWAGLNGTTYSSTSQNATNLAPGTYQVTVSDASGCTAKFGSPVTIGEPASALDVAVTFDPADCAGGMGSIFLNVTGGWQQAPYSFNWSDMPGTNDPEDRATIPVGTYSVTVTDAGSCSVVKSNLAVTGPLSAIGYATDPLVTNAQCPNTNNGAISIFPNNGNGAPFTVNWGNSVTATTTAVTGLAGGTYTPTVTDAGGCTAVMPAIVVTQPALLTISATVNPIGATSGSIVVAVTGGTGSFSYTWSGPNGPLTETSNTLSGITLPGQYTVTIVDNAFPNCPIPQSYTMPGAVFSPSLIGSNDACEGDGCLFILVPGAGSGSYTVVLNGTTYTPAVSGDTLAVCGLAPGTYAPTVSNGTLSLPVAAVTIDQLDMPVFGSTYSDPNGSNNGSIAIEPNGSTYTYKWSTGATTQTINNLGPGTYTVTVTNPVTGCVETQEFTLDFSALSVSDNATNPSCVTSTNGAITLNYTGGYAPFTYSWAGPNGPIAGNSATISGLGAGTYNVTVTEFDNVTTTHSVTLTAQSNVTITNVNETSVFGQYQTSGACDGQASVVFTGNAAGSVTIVWSSNAIGPIATNLCGGAYSVTVTDALGCSSVWSNELTSPPAIGASAEIVSYNGYGVSCHGDCDGEATVFIQGGLGNYRVQWPTGPSETIVNGSFSQRVGLCAGTYTVTITDRDGLGVSSVTQVEITEPDPITAVFAVQEPSTFFSCDGEIIVQPNGTVGPIDYLWSTSFGRGGNNQRAEGLCPNEVVTFIIRDDNGCEVQVHDTVPYPPDGCLQVSPVLTPGEADGKNDWVEISCIESSPKNTVEIYNRWGQLVYDATAYNNGSVRWDGLTKQGQPLAEGVYYYVLKYTDDQGHDQQRKGHINLLR